MASLRVIAFFGLGAVAEAASVICSSNGGAACSRELVDEVSQLQHTMLREAQETKARCNPACKNYGRCQWGHCHCVGGYSGHDCSVITELASSQNYTKGCGNGFTVYPYIQPGLWGTYDGWQLCGAGKEQSPINIWSSHTVNAKPLNLSIKALANPPRLNTGHSIEYEGEFLKLTLGKTTFTSAQFHFHTPSEHKVNGWQYAFEMHVVTASEDGGIAVIGILFKFGKRNKCLDNLLKTPLPGAGCQDHVGAIDLSCFNQQLSGPYYTYDGSLTTPPCTEGLKWNVMRNIATMSWSQLMAFKTRYLMNARPVQPLNGRKVALNKVH